jgi:hypothetical protein
LADRGTRGRGSALFGCQIRSPRGPHRVFSHPGTNQVATVPFNRPIKPVYVKQFVVFIDSIKEQGHED